MCAPSKLSAQESCQGGAVMLRLLAVAATAQEINFDSRDFSQIAFAKLVVGAGNLTSSDICYNNGDCPPAPEPGTLSGGVVGLRG